MHPTKFTYTPADDDDNGYADDATAAAGTPFTLLTTTPGDGLAHPVIITPSGAVTGDYTITGTDSDGLAQSEVLATDAGNAVTSAKHYATVTEVLAPSGLGAETVDIGWTDVATGPTFVTNWRQDNFQVSLGVDVTGTINYTVQHTLERMSSGQPSTFSWFNHSTLASKTVDADGNYAFPVTGTRITVNSSTAPSTLVFMIVQGH
jgi:hypothetical protein